MTSAEIICRPRSKLRRPHQGQEAGRHRSVYCVEPGDLLAVCRFLRDDPRSALRAPQLHQRRRLSGARSRRIAAESRFRARTGSRRITCRSFPTRHRFVLKLILPCWKDNARPVAGGAVGHGIVGSSRLARYCEVYDLSGVWFTGHPDLTPDLLAQDWEVTATQGLRVPTGISWDSRAMTISKGGESAMTPKRQISGLVERLRWTAIPSNCSTGLHCSCGSKSVWPRPTAAEGIEGFHDADFDQIGGRKRDVCLCP